MAMPNHALRPKLPVLFVGHGSPMDAIQFGSVSMGTVLFQPTDTSRSQFSLPSVPCCLG
jgi:hypothetical protein